MSVPPADTPLLTAQEFMERYGDCGGPELIDGRVMWGGRYLKVIGPLMSEEEFLGRYDGGDKNMELLDGVVVEDDSAIGALQGYVSANIAGEITAFVRERRLGRMFANHVFVRIRRHPDRIRGADILFVGHEKMPPGKVPDGVIAVPPDLVVEVVPSADRWLREFNKAVDYLTLGARVVLLVFLPSRTVTAFRPDTPPQTFAVTDTLAVPDVLPGFAVPVAALFE